MKSEILELLRSTTEYVSGQELCERFGVSRTAVWKAIESLKKDGYTIEAVRNRGYKLSDEDADIFNERELAREFEKSKFIRKSFFYETIGSTNTEAKRLADEGEAERILVAADRQVSGKGRRGREWVSPAGKNVYFSLMLKPDIYPEKAPMLTLVMAMAVAKVLNHMRPASTEKDIPEVNIKWPNDILIGGKKVCGILTEMSVENTYIHYVVIGVGINVKRQSFEKEISATASSVEKEWGISVNRCNLVGNIMKAFEEYLESFLEKKDLSGLREEYESFLINMNREVRILDPKGEYNAVARGINTTGELIVKKEDGQIVNIYAGEVSVRGIYGYT